MEHLAPHDRLAALGLALPPAPKPAGVYKPCLIDGHHVYVSGHGPLQSDGSLIMGRVGRDLDSDAGTRHFAGHRLGCWINAIPANGLVLIPEASAGCVCLFSIAATIRS